MAWFKKTTEHLKWAIQHGAFVNSEDRSDYYLYFNNEYFLSNETFGSPEFLDLYEKSLQWMINGLKTKFTSSPPFFLLTPRLCKELRDILITKRK